MQRTTLAVMIAAICGFSLGLNVAALEKAFFLGMREGRATVPPILIVPGDVCNGLDNDCPDAVEDNGLDHEMLIVPDHSGSMGPALERLRRSVEPPPPIRQRAPLPPGTWEI